MPSSSTEARTRHPILFRVAAVALGLALALATLEITLRLLPVANAPPPRPVNAGNPIFHLEPKSEFTWSIGWNFAAVNHGRTNDQGFVNDQEYDPDGPGPLLAVVGDSYVEALMVPYADTLHGRLAHRVGESGRVYSFAASGAPLSQYLVWMRHARERFGADGLAVVVVGNDFDESLARYRQRAGFHHFVADGAGGLALRRVDYVPSGLRRTLRHSALARYLVFNVHAETAVRGLLEAVFSRARAQTTPDFVGNTSAAAGEQRLALSRRAVDAFLERAVTMTGLPPSRIAFLVDALRPQIYEGRSAEIAVADSYFARMREYFMMGAARRGHEVVDLSEAFRARHLEDGGRFEFEHDNHWNARGHAEAARALSRTALVRVLFGSLPAP